MEGVLSEEGRRKAAKKRAIEIACAFSASNYDEHRGLVKAVAGSVDCSENQTVYGAMAFLQSGVSENITRANAMLCRLPLLKDRFALNAAILTLTRLGNYLEKATADHLKCSLRKAIDEPAEDIIAGRNTNLPLQTWTVRLTSGIWFGRPDVVERGTLALQQLEELVRCHGTIPEFNSPVYHGVTLTMLRILSTLGHPQVSPIAERLERHLWKEVALRFHPGTRILGGPWSRIYHDGLVGGASLLNVLMDMVWGAFYDPTVAEKYDHGFEMNCGGLFSSFADECPVDRRLALEKQLPLTVVARSEQVDYRVGSTWVPGGIAEVVTWMDERVCVGTASRSHLHGMQNATYYACWSRGEKPVQKLNDLGVAFSRFIQNGQRPGKTGYRYRNHLNGYTMMMNSCYWADDGRPFAFQSGSTAVILYVPKAQERLYVSSLEMFMVFPRLDTIDGVYVDGKRLNELAYDGQPDVTVVVRSGVVSMGMRFRATDDTLTSPRMRVEVVNDHLLVGLKLVEFLSERELPESEYRRYGGTIGAELRFTPDTVSFEQLVQDMRESSLKDTWWMGAFPQAFGGPRKICFQVGEKRLWGRFAPVAETWLARHAPTAAGNVRYVLYEEPAAETLDHVIVHGVKNAIV